VTATLAGGSQSRAVPAVVESTDPKLKAALDDAFAEPKGGPVRGTKAVVIVYDGKIIAERYAPDVGVDTPLVSWSVAKSVINALTGVLVREGRLSLDEPAPVKAWSGWAREKTRDPAPIRERLDAQAGWGSNPRPLD
jgi:CubicO group peptidase (beta-lactamase class C family)